jgi:hypothetical protein
MTSSALLENYGAPPKTRYVMCVAAEDWSLLNKFQTAESLTKRPHRTILTMKQLQPLADSESPFFRLPREIRDQIYGHIWKDTRKIRQWYKQKHYTVTYDLGSTAHEKLPVEKAL